MKSYCERNSFLIFRSTSHKGFETLMGRLVEVGEAGSNRLGDVCQGGLSMKESEFEFRTYAFFILNSAKRCER